MAKSRGNTPDWDNIKQPEDRTPPKEPSKQPQPTPRPQPQAKPTPKPKPPSNFILAHTVTKPHSAYAQLELTAADPTALTLDALQLRGYLTTALTRFLGASGSAMPVDVLQLSGAEAWVRVPREDLSAFVAALGAWPGATQEGIQVMLRVKAAGNWLGALLGRSEQGKLWG